MYRLQPIQRFRRELRKLPGSVQRRVLERVAELAEDPFLGKPLRGGEVEVLGQRFRPYSLRVGDYRVLYVIEHLTRTVYLYSVGHRSQVYRGLKRSS